MTTAVTPTPVGEDVGKIVTDKDRVRSRALKIILLELSPTDGGATFSFDLKSYGIVKVLGIRGVRHTTIDSVLDVEAPTTSLSGTTMTITLSSVIPTKARSFLVFAEV